MKDYVFTTIGDMIDGSMGNMSDEQIDSDLKWYKKVARKLKVKNMDDVVVYVDDEGCYNPNYYQDDKKIKSMFENMAMDIVNGNIYIYFANEDDGTEYLSGVDKINNGNLEENNSITESTGVEVSNSISTAISEMYTSLSELDALIMKSSNRENKLVKKDINEKIAQLSSSLSSIKNLLKSYRPNRDFSISIIKDRISDIYLKDIGGVSDNIEKFLLAHGADRKSDNMFTGVSDEDIRKLYALVKS